MPPTTMLPKLTETTQTIYFSEEDDGGPQTSGEVFATNVLVTTSAGAHSHGSSKVKLKSLVDYNWEPKFYPGQLLAAHVSGQYLAYCIKAPNALNPGTWCGMVRVVYNPEPGTDRRALIKGMKGEVQDLAFAHIQNQVVLACIDEQGNFFVHEIEVTDSGLRCTLVAEVREDTGAAAAGAPRRVVWCPYIPDDDDAPDDDVARLLLTTHGSVARMWNMRAVVKCVQPPEFRGNASDLLHVDGVLTASEHTGAIVDAAFSPDGTALATASADGYVMFFQVYMHSEGSPRCLHKWQPHSGRPLSCLFFLDNHKHFNSDVQFWKFAITGAENNTVIKIWSCKSWNCLQTITFTPGLAAEPAFGLKAMLDTSASYLLLSDYRARSLYVLNMARDEDDTTAHCKNISEFLLPYPVLSFCIVDADEEQVKCESSCDDPFHRNGAVVAAESPDEFDRDMELEAVEAETAKEEEAGAARRLVRVRLYIVQPKGLQEGELLYAPPPPGAATLLPGISDLTIEDKADPPPAAIASSILQQQSQQLKNLLMRSQTQPGSLISQRPESPASLLLNLMTPDAFSSSPGKREEDDPPLSATPDVGKLSRTSTAGPAEGKLVSGGSSPSREVRDILAHNDAYFKDNLEVEVCSHSPVPEADADVQLQNGSEPASCVEPLFAEPAPPPAPAHPPVANKLAHTNSDTSWPLISLAQITEANQRKASSDKSSSHSLNNSLNVSGVERACSEEVRVSGLSPGDKTRLEMLEQKLDKLCDLVTQQSHSLRALRAEVATSAAAADPRALLDEALHAHAQRTQAALHAALSDGWERIARLGEAAATRAATAAGVGAARALEPLAAALQHELAAKLSATDHLLRDNIDKLASSKTVMERLSTSIARSLSDMVRDSLRAALADSVMPVMEKAHAQLFRQINVAFQNGTKEFVARTESRARAAAERGGEAAAAGLCAALERHGELLRAAPLAPAPAPVPPHAAIAAAVSDAARSVLEKEMVWWREQALAVATQMSRAHSPATPAASHASAASRQMQVAQIQSLLAAGDTNGAFQLALSASDLVLVVAACRDADPGAVFGPPCRLKQHVLLSLVQQLAADMSRDTQLKHRYLEEAVMNLDTNNPVTREHLPAVIRELQKQVMSFLSANPAHALTRQFKMLLMATESLVKSAV